MRPGSRVHILRAVQFGNPAPLAAAPNTGSHGRTQSWCELFHRSHSAPGSTQRIGRLCEHAASCVSALRAV